MQSIGNVGLSQEVGEPTPWIRLRQRSSGLTLPVTWTDLLGWNISWGWNLIFSFNIYRK